MDAHSMFRRLRGAVGNAVVWGAIWSIATLAVFLVMRVAGEPVAWDHAWRSAAQTGVVGGIASSAFSLVIGLQYRGRRLSEISWLRFGIGGGIVAGVCVPTMMFVGRTLSGDGPLPMEKWISSALIAAVFGSIAAAATMKLAQRGDTLLHGGSQDEPERLEAGDSLASPRAQQPQGRKVAARPDAEE